MKTLSFESLRSIDDNSLEIGAHNLNLFKNRGGYWCCSFDVNRYNGLKVGSSGICREAINPETKEKLVFDYTTRYLMFDLIDYRGIVERSLELYIIPENETEGEEITMSKEAVVTDGWSFRVCFIPINGFHPA